MVVSRDISVGRKRKKSKGRKEKAMAVSGADSVTDGSALCDDVGGYLVVRFDLLRCSGWSCGGRVRVRSRSRSRSLLLIRCRDEATRCRLGHGVPTARLTTDSLG